MHDFIDRGHTPIRHRSRSTGSPYRTPDTARFATMIRGGACGHAFAGLRGARLRPAPLSPRPEKKRVSTGAWSRGTCVGAWRGGRPRPARLSAGSEQ